MNKTLQNKSSKMNSNTNQTVVEHMPSNNNEISDGINEIRHSIERLSTEINELNDRLTGILAGDYPVEMSIGRPVETQVGDDIVFILTRIDNCAERINQITRRVRL